MSHTYSMMRIIHVVTPSHSVKHPLEHTLVFEVLEEVYHLKIHQPPISVVFAWDNSGSVSPYREQIKMAVHQYVSKIEEGIDHVNLLCFSNPPRFILSDFSSNAQETQSIFNNYDWNCNSSQAEDALQKATMALDKEEGIKAVILIADADGGRKETLWESLQKVNPKVFSIRVASSYDSKVFANLMHSWSRVNNGTYSVVENSTQMTQAIDHAMHVLKRPVHYTLKMQSAYVRPLDDGLLKIITSKRSETKSKEVNKNLAIELILDASGSMLKRIQGKRRIDIAKEVLIKAVQETIPAQTLVALRVFGHRKADACRTDLKWRLQALNVKKMTKILKK
ncbi:MAG: VWA domain-containing protein [Sulfurovum sp.]|nr:VWA domain-containing protein [Sulfurovum sp.]